MYLLIRVFLFGFVFFFACSFAVVVFKIKKRDKWAILTVVTAVLLGIGSTILDVENWFYTFPTPEAALHYTDSGVVMMAVDGKESTLVFYQNEGTALKSLPRTEKGWKMSGAIGLLHEVSHSRNREIYVTIDRHKNTDDYYVSIWDAYNKLGENPEIYDNCSSSFSCYRSEDDPEPLFDITFSSTFHCAYVSGLDIEEYELFVNGEQFTFSPNRFWPLPFE